MTKIYGIVSGDYEEYNIRCVCRSKKEAYALVDKLNTDSGYAEFSVEEFPICDSSIEKVKRLTLWVTIFQDRTEVGSGRREDEFWPFDLPESDIYPSVNRSDKRMNSVGPPAPRKRNNMDM